MSDNHKYILYARKSTEGEDRQVESIDNQIEVLQKLADRLNLNVVLEIVDSKSAKTPYQREGFDQMLKLINVGKADAVLCWQINRLSRNPAESGILQQMLQDETIRCIRTHDRYYLSEDNAVVFSVEASIGNQFIRDLRKNVKWGVEHKLRHGGLSGQAPEGYLNKEISGVKRIVKDPQRYHVLRKAFDLFLTGNYSAHQVRTILNEEWGYTTRRRKNRYGDGPMSRASFYYMLRNPRYAGKIPNNYDQDGEPFNTNFDRMITPEEYDRVQDLLGTSGCPRLCKSKDFALKGFIRCGECGCMITAESKKKLLVNGETNHYVYYHCTGKRPCNQRGTIREEALFKQLDELLEGYELSPNLFEWGMKALDEIAKEEISERDQIQALQFESIKNIQNRLDKLLDMATKDLLTNDEYKQKSAALKLELAKRQKDQSESATRAKNWYEIIGQTLELLTNANNKFVTGDINDKKEILLAIGQNPVILDRKLQITPNEWLLPIKKALPELRADEQMVRTKVISSHKNASLDREAKMVSVWYARQDSNLRPFGSKPNTLIR